jgi:uncharacterized protein (UPF0147 family)
MDEEQVGNAQEASESDIQETASEDFFGNLDKSLNSGILESEDELLQSTSDNDGDNTPLSQSEVQQQDDDVLQKRYSDSSREAQRLNGKLKEIEPYMPILDAMKEDPNLIKHVRNYFEGGGQTPVSMKETLKLPEDFVFDADDAFSDPESDSSKVFGATVDGIVQRRLNSALTSQKNENQKLARETSFRQNHEMSDGEWSEFVDFAKSKSLELEDIYFLMNRKKRDTNIADNARQQVATQMKKTQNQPRSLATAGSTAVEQTQDDQVFDALMGIDQELDNAFG